MQLRPIESLDCITEVLRLKAWNNCPSSLDEATSRIIISSTERLERAKYLSIGIPSVHKNELSSSWTTRLLIGPGHSDGLGNYDLSKSLGRFVSHGMRCDAIDLLKKIKRRHKTFNRDNEPGDHRNNFDEHENMELFQQAISSVLRDLKPGNQMHDVLIVMQDYHREFHAWPSFHFVAEKLGVYGNRNHICSAVKLLIKLVNARIRLILGGN